jgi:hypothetical protein
VTWGRRRWGLRDGAGRGAGPGHGAGWRWGRRQGWDDADRTQPCGGEDGPVGFGLVDGEDAEAVAAGGKDVELGWDLGVFESAEVDKGVFYVDGIVFGLEKEGRRRVLIGSEDGVELFAIGLGGEIAGVDDEGEVGASVDGGVDVGCGGSGFDVLVVGMGAEEDGEVGAGGEADDADFVGIDVPVGGVGAGDAHGLLRVFEVGRVGRVAAFFGHTVFDEEAGDADGVEPVADIEAFAIPCEDAIATAGKDEDGGMGVVAAGRRIDAKGGNGDVGETAGAAAADETVGGFGRVGFRVGGLRGLGCGVRPEGKSGLLGRRCKGREEKSEGRQGEDGGTKSHAEYSKPI